MRILLTCLAFAVCLAALPVQSEESAYDKLANEFVAPCCWQEALAAHRSPIADEARAELRRLVDEGRSETEIREWFVTQYGERVLITPSGAKARALFWAPFLVAVGAAAVAAAALYRWTMNRAARGVESDPHDATDDSEWDW